MPKLCHNRRELTCNGGEQEMGQTEAVLELRPSWQEICEAHARIAPRIHRTPVMTSQTLDRMAGAQLFFKCDNFQKTGSFKIRGATNAIFSLTDEEARRGIVTLSSGNHAAAVACAAAWRGTRAWIVMPKNAPRVKCEAVEGYGGKIAFCEPTVSARKEMAERVQAVVPVKAVSHNVKSREVTTHKLAIHWVWQDGDWYLAEKGIVEEK